MFGEGLTKSQATAVGVMKKNHERIRLIHENRPEVPDMHLLGNIRGRKVDQRPVIMKIYQLIAPHNLP
jgi:hypothetical protein